MTEYFKAKVLTELLSKFKTQLVFQKTTKFAVIDISDLIYIYDKTI